MNMLIEIPYSRGERRIEIPKGNLLGVFASACDGKTSAEVDETALVEDALDNPIASQPFEELADGKEKVVIITSDHTRPLPSFLTLPILLERVKRGNPSAKITILVATGYHRATTNDELTAKFGSEIVECERIVVHDAFDESSLTHIGVLPSGGDCRINSIACGADLLVAEGFIEPHFFAGFSGGRKSVLPGVAGASTVLANHCAEFIANPNARTGNLDGNPIHEDMLYATEEVGLKFILNVALNEDKGITAAFAGHFEKAHLAGCDFVGKRSKIERAQADVVVTSNGGYPLDQNIYQAVKGMTAGEAMTRPGGTIIMLAACEDGHGGEGFFKALSNASSPAELLAEVVLIPRDRTKPDQWEYQILARILSKRDVIIVSELQAELVESMHLRYAADFDQALEMALKRQGGDAKIAVVPNGVSCFC
ncbi:MAG: nickel-dependent lactate racemase [Victivallales bacterium]|nr:nickel-dependent lactate racemase [Victivallales bacterium]